MERKCKDCPSFHIQYMPMMPFDTGLATCDKYDLEVDFGTMRKINRITCVEEDENNAANQSRLHR